MAYHLHEGHVAEYPVEMVTVTCGGCGVVFGMSRTFYDVAHRDGVSFRCINPKCNWPSQSYTDTTQKELRREREARERAERRVAMERNMRQAEERRVVAYKGVVTRTKRRIAAGVCPCCKRTFKDLADHMKAKHPSYGGEEAR